MASSRGEINLDLERKLLSKIDENVLLCAVCQDRFNAPKILPCLHSFCEQCLKLWIHTNSGRLTCPTCKRTSTLPSNGVPDITNNRFINDLLDVIKEMDKEMRTSPQCEGCYYEAKFWCGDCDQFFCDECVKSHSVVRSLKGHQLITIEVYKAKKESPDFRALRPRFCENHYDNKLEYFCDTCKVPVCLKCTVVEHVTHSHKIEPIEKSCEAQIPIIKKNIIHLKQKASEVRKAERETKAKIIEFELNQSGVRKQIKANISKLRDALEEEEKRLLGQVDDICKSRGKQSDSNLEYLQNELASAESRSLYLEQLLIHGGPVDIMIVGSELDKVVAATAFLCDLSDISSYIAFEENTDCTILAGNVRSEQLKRASILKEAREPERREMSMFPGALQPSSTEKRSTPMLPLSEIYTEPVTFISPTSKCPICQGIIRNGKVLQSCQHAFCMECIETAMDSIPVCPLCGIIYGPMRGDQPHGAMDILEDKSRALPGYRGCGTICITYTFPDGIQTGRHPHPGSLYQGTTQTAYLPNNSQGREVLQLLKRAFQAKLLFTVGQSVTTGLDDAVVWKIHQKTSRRGGPAKNGYPDPTYFGRIKEELAAKGIE